MSDTPNDRETNDSETNESGSANEREDAATQAAQNVVGEVTSWEYSAEPDTIEATLDDGLREAGVEVDDGERRRLVEEIDEVKHDESSGTPQVRSADPAGDAQG